MRSSLRARAGQVKSSSSKVLAGEELFTSKVRQVQELFKSKGRQVMSSFRARKGRWGALEEQGQAG